MAVDKALTNACLDNPKENDVLCLTDSKRASIKSDEHRRDNLAVKAIAVMKLAIFSGNNVGDALYKLVEYDVNCCVETTMLKKKSSRKKIGRKRGDPPYVGSNLALVTPSHVLLDLHVISGLLYDTIMATSNNLSRRSLFVSTIVHIF